MSNRFISLSTNDYDDITGAIYDIIDGKTKLELTNDDYDKIEEGVISLIDYLNEE